MDSSKFVATQMVLVQLRGLPDRTSRNLRKRPTRREEQAGVREKEKQREVRIFSVQSMHV